VDARQGASETVANLQTEVNDVRETLMSMSDAAPQEIAEQREQVAEEVAALSATVRRESFEMRSDLES
jgi:predicted regulator of Ras-like GTPase activity (Roadblock/LC7/MglB family)